MSLGPDSSHYYHLHGDSKFDIQRPTTMESSPFSCPILQKDPLLSNVLVASSYLLELFQGHERAWFCASGLDTCKYSMHDVAKLCKM